MINGLDIPSYNFKIGNGLNFNRNCFKRKRMRYKMQ